VATLTIKNIPEPLVKRLKQQAATHRRSLNFQVISYLEQMSTVSLSMPMHYWREPGPFAELRKG